MSAIRKMIIVTEQQDRWIAAQVTAGRFVDDSELIRHLIRREQERSEDTATAAIRDALVQGEDSGEPQAFDFTAFAQRKRAQHSG